MSHTPRTLAFSLASLFALAACGNPVVGEWEAKDGPVCDGTERLSEFEVDDDLKLDGKIWLVVEDQETGVPYCHECDIEGDIEEDGDDEYTADVEISGCSVSCNGETDGEAECEMNDDGDEMDCILTIGICELDELTFEKQE